MAHGDGSGRDVRLTSALRVSAMMRRVSEAGGNVVVVARGDPTAGAVLVICMERGVVQSVRERILGKSGAYAWVAVGPDEPVKRKAYLDRRRTTDSDIWIIELDIANAERFAAETGV